MRKLMWFTLGFGISCLLCAYVLPKQARWVLMPCIALIAAGVWFWDKGRKRLSTAAMVLLGCAGGLCWFSLYAGFYLNDAVALDGLTRNAVFRASDYGYETTYGSAVDAAVVLNGKTYQVLVYLQDTQPLEPGDKLEGQFRFRVTTPDGAGGATYHQGKGIFLLAYQSGPVTVTEATEASVRDLPAKMRQGIKEILRACFPADTYPFAKALLLGDTTDLSYETDTDFQLSGIRHVVAVSGLHVSVLYALLSFVTCRKRILSALIGFPALLLFAAVAGFTPSVTRACLMSALMLLALLCNKEYDGATALSFAALITLFFNPLVITNLGFQLSVGSVAGIFLFGSGIRKWLVSLFAGRKGGEGKAFFIRWLTGAVSVTLSAQVFTMPLCAWVFGTVSLVGVVTNLLTLWVISFLFCGIIAACLLSLLWPAGAAVLGFLLSWPIRYVLLVSKVLANFPLAAVYTESPWIVAWLVLVYLLLILFLLRQNSRLVPLTCCAVLGLCFALLASWGLPRLDNTRLTVLDVGQGQCLLLQSEGRTYLVDCGGDSGRSAADLAAATLLSQGVTHLNGLILTCGNQDHVNGAAYLLSRVDTDLLILVPEAASLAAYTDGQVVYVESNLALTFGDTALCVYASPFSGNTNENSLCILFDTEKCDILITGDRSSLGEKMLLRSADIPDVDILIAGHHGATDSTCEELLRAVRPETVCISAGRDNSFGYPSEELLARLHFYDCTVYRTDQNGSILIRR